MSRAGSVVAGAAAFSCVARHAQGLEVVEGRFSTLQDRDDVIQAHAVFGATSQTPLAPRPVDAGAQRLRDVGQTPGGYHRFPARGGVCLFGFPVAVAPSLLRRAAALGVRLVPGVSLFGSALPILPGILALAVGVGLAPGGAAGATPDLQPVFAASVHGKRCVGQGLLALQACLFHTAEFAVVTVRTCNRQDVQGVLTRKLAHALEDEE